MAVRLCLGGNDCALGSIGTVVVLRKQKGIECLFSFSAIEAKKVLKRKVWIRKAMMVRWAQLARWSYSELEWRRAQSSYLS